MAGLSMGGMETHSIALKHLDVFSHIGLLSGGGFERQREIGNHHGRIHGPLVNPGFNFGAYVAGERHALTVVNRLSDSIFRRPRLRKAKTQNQQASRTELFCQKEISF